MFNFLKQLFRRKPATPSRRFKAGYDIAEELTHAYGDIAITRLTEFYTMDAKDGDQFALGVMTFVNNWKGKLK